MTDGKLCPLWRHRTMGRMNAIDNCASLRASERTTQIAEVTMREVPAIQTEEFTTEAQKHGGAFDIPHNFPRRKDELMKFFAAVFGIDLRLRASVVKIFAWNEEMRRSWTVAITHLSALYPGDQFGNASAHRWSRADRACAGSMARPAWRAVQDRRQEHRPGTGVARHGGAGTHA